MIVESEASSCLRVLFGLPQGSLQGPVLFVLYINDLPFVTKDGSDSIYADNTKLFRAITSRKDVENVQADLDEMK